MRVVNFNIDLPEIKIIPLADLHIGSPQADEPLIKHVCDYIAHTDGVYTIINGDVMDNVTRSSVGDIFEETMSPQAQVNRAVYYLKEIAEKGKIINLTSGNHEQRTSRETGLSLTDMLLAHLLRYDPTLNDRYCDDGAFTFITLKPRKKSNATVTFTCFNLHGNGGGLKVGSKIQKLDDLSQIVSANLYIRSHTHIPETHRGVIMNVNTNEHTVREEDCVFVNTNAFLRYNGSYGARQGMRPMSRAIPVITLRTKRVQHGSKDTYHRYIECVFKEDLEDL